MYIIAVCVPTGKISHRFLSQKKNDGNFPMHTETSHKKKKLIKALSFSYSVQNWRKELV